MPTAFARSLRSIEGEGARLVRVLALPLLVVLVAWSVWMARAEVPLYVSSGSARLVRERAVHPLESAVDGRVLALHALLEQPVEAGALLVELDGRAQDLALTEERARLTALEGELESTRAALSALERAREEARAAAEAARREAELELETRRLSLAYAQEEAERLSELEKTGDVSKLSASRARNEADKARVAVEAQEARLARLALDRRRDDGDRAAAEAERRHALAEMDGERGVRQATLARLEHERELFRVCAPASGQVGALAPLSPGTFVKAGEPLGSVVSDARLTVEAEFDPADALGRVRLGQRGELALTGFPRAQFGALEVEVERIASEARDGRIRVELLLLSPERARVPLEHGLPGAVRIEVERLHPVSLLLRSVSAALALGRPARDA